MRVYFSPESDPMITDTVAGLNALASRIAEFLDSEDRSLYLQADTTGSAAPYEALLPGVEFVRVDGPILVSLASEFGLRVTGSAENLRIWASHFKFSPHAVDGDHHHPEHVMRVGYIDSRTLSVIIEVQDAE